jgi:hypothetical protein
MDPNNIFAFSGGLTVLIVGITCVVTLGTLAFTAVILWFTLGPLLRNMNQRSQILKSGTPAQAVITTLADTGMLVNNQPQVRIGLQVTPPNGAPYPAEVTMVVSQLLIPRVQPGMMVPVMIDPQDPGKVAIAM